MVNADQYAASLDGTVKKGKAFLFVDYERIRLVIPSSSKISIVKS